MPNYKVRHQCDGPNGKQCWQCAFYEDDEDYFRGEVYRKETCAMGHKDYVSEEADACKDFREE